jgi:hypothetical protein
MSSISEAQAPAQGGSARDEAAEAAGPGGTGARDVTQATGPGYGDVAGPVSELAGAQEDPGAGREGACLYGGIPGQGKSGAVNVLAAELAAREGGPHGRA